MSPPADLQRVERKLNVALALVGLLFLSAAFLVILARPWRVPQVRTNPATGRLTLGRPFSGDFEGSPEQRSLVDRAQKTNGPTAAKINLLSLDLTGVNLTAEDYQTLGAMAELRELSLQQTNITDDELPELLDLFRLESLDLSGTAISDASLSNLKQLKNLRKLDVSKTQVSAAGVRDLHANMPELHARLYGSHTGHNQHCMHTALGKIVLARYGGDRIAFKFTEPTTSGDGGVKYVWYWQPQAGEFHSPALKTGTGEVFEKYRRSKSAEGRDMLTDAGGKQELEIGPARLHWSRQTTVYFPRRHENTPPTTFALTPWEKLEDIDFADPSLTWCENTSRLW